MRRKHTSDVDSYYVIGKSPSEELHYIILGHTHINEPQQNNFGNPPIGWYVLNISNSNDHLRVQEGKNNKRGDGNKQRVEDESAGALTDCDTKSLKTRFD
jgi:hypothetical protein